MVQRGKKEIFEPSRISGAAARGVGGGGGGGGGRHADAFRRRGVDGRIRRLDWFPRRQASTGVVRRRHVTTR